MPHPARDSGFTLIELLVVISLLGTMMTIAVTGWSTWGKTRAHLGAAEELQTVLRQTQQRAVSESTPLCVRFDTTNAEYTVYRSSCDGTDVVLGPIQTSSPDVYFRSTTFGADLEFLPSGRVRSSADYPDMPEIRVARHDRTDADDYLVTVSELTGRASLG